ncbi:MAG: MBL fold metallo-hydrolase [Paludibacteraceae bacterium]|nr:MBL fold metallo-hydrolase [Paludibacteraceae bacterium]
MLEVKCFELGSFGTNTYIVSDDEGHVLLVDPACCSQYEQQQLYRYIEDMRSKISGFQLQIVATHGHLDHLWGAPWACEQWHMPVLMHEADIEMAKAMQEQYNWFGIRAEAKPFPIKKLEAGELGMKGLDVIETPGHTPGSVCLYWPEEKKLLSGDTLFCMGYGRTDLPGGDIGLLFRSLNRLFALPSDVQVYPGHGEDTTIGAEKR